MRPRVLFYVQHLLGIGHIKRASLLNGLARVGQRTQMLLQH
ncbi:MAG: hypothetical protein V7629_03650 [Motiliproteus sp.]